MRAPAGGRYGGVAGALRLPALRFPGLRSGEGVLMAGARRLPALRFPGLRSGEGVLVAGARRLPALRFLVTHL
ncbi:hypothetical protein EHJ10_15755 [Cronobacter dublinensis]|nr:hypothetical protein [Cronobacter dublinensis]